MKIESQMSSALGDVKSWRGDEGPIDATGQAVLTLPGEARIAR
jgi:hypothetical protein